MDVIFIQDVAFDGGCIPVGTKAFLYGNGRLRIVDITTEQYNKMGLSVGAMAVFDVMDKDGKILIPKDSYKEVI